MLSLSPQAERGKELEKFTERRRFLFDPRQNMDAATTKGLGLLAPDLAHLVQQTQPQSRFANRDSSPVRAALTRTHSDAAMILPAPAENTPLTLDLQRGEVKGKASEQLAAEGSVEKRSKSPPRIDAGEVADRVHRLMRYDLVLEKERATKLGG